MSSNKPAISVVISTYNKKTSLELTLHAYKNQSLVNFEVIVADDGSSDGTTEYIRECIEKNTFPYKLKYAWQPDEGFRLARVRNCGWRIAEADRVVFTDHDLVPNPDCLAMYDTFRRKEEVGIAGYIGWIDESIHRSFGIEQICSLGSFDQYMTEPERRNLSKYNYLVLWGGNMSLPRRVLQEVGGFDEDFKAYGGEDTDLALRLHRMRVPIVTLPQAKMFHLNHPFRNRVDENGNELVGSKLFYDVKMKDTSIKRNANASYEDVLCM